MPSVKEEFERLKWLINTGKENERCTPAVLVKQAAKERIANKGKKPKTKFIFETDSPEAYSDLNREKDRILETAGNKTVGISIMVDWLRALTTERITKKLSEGEHQQKEGGPPKAELPKWMEP